MISRISFGTMATLKPATPRTTSSASIEIDPTATRELARQIVTGTPLSQALINVGAPPADAAETLPKTADRVVLHAGG